MKTLYQHFEKFKRNHVDIHIRIRLDLKNGVSIFLEHYTPLNNSNTLNVRNREFKIQTYTPFTSMSF